MSFGLLVLTTTTLLAAVAHAQVTCSADFSDCLDPVRAAGTNCGTGAYKSALECGAKLFTSTDCQSDTNQLFLAGGMIGMHASCMMVCGTAADCPFDGSQYTAALNKVGSISESERDCLVGLVDCQSGWNKCSAGTCQCTESGIACSRVAAAPCPSFSAEMGGIPSTLATACKQLGKCTVAQCDSAVSSSAPIALVAAISAFLFAMGH